MKTISLLRPVLVALCLFGASDLVSASAPSNVCQDPKPVRVEGEVPDVPAAPVKKAKQAGDQKPVSDAKPVSDQKPAGDVESAGDGKPDKAVVNQMLAEVKKHEVRVARIVKLQEVFAEKSEAAKVSELDGMMADEKTRHQKAMDAFRTQLGADTFAKVQGPIADMQGKRGKAHAEAKKVLKESMENGKGKEKGDDADADAKGKGAEGDKGKGHKPGEVEKGNDKGKKGQPDDVKGRGNKKN